MLFLAWPARWLVMPTKGAHTRQTGQGRFYNAGFFAPPRARVPVMPIYAYKCTSCGATKDALQKMSDPPLTVCPACGKPTLQKQVTAAGFQLKGSGWYATDFANAPCPAVSEAKANDAPPPACAASCSASQ